MAPITLHSKIKDSLELLAQTNEISFEIDKPGFGALASKEPNRLISIVSSTCYLEKQIEYCPIRIPLPKARVVELDNQRQENASASAKTSLNTSTVKVSHSTVTILIGDLARQIVSLVIK